MHGVQQRHHVGALGDAEAVEVDVPGGGVRGAQRDDAGPPQNLEERALRVGQVRQVLELGKTSSAHDLVQLLADLTRHLGVVQHEHHGPLQGRLDGLHASGEEVADDLLHLAVVVLALEQLVAALLLFGVLDLEQVRVDQVADVAAVEGLAVTVHGLLEEAAHLLAVLHQLLARPLQAGDELENGQEVDPVESAEEAEAFLDQVHEAFEARVVVLEAHAHDEGADHVADGRPEDGTQVGGRSLPPCQGSKDGFHLTLWTIQERP